MITFVVLVVLGLPLLVFLVKRARRRSGIRPITYSIHPVPGRLRHSKRGSKL